jgi:hypothetical protein
MKKFPHFLTILLVVVFSACSVDDNPDPVLPEDEVPFLEGTTISFATKEEAQAKLGTSDAYTQVLTQFDIASRTRNADNTEEQDYLDFAASQAQDWTEAEIASLKLGINNVKSKIEEMGLNLNFPENIDLIKSAMLEEGGAVSYTREEYIVVKGAVEEDLIIHELFHILSRNNPGNRDALFATINFEKTNRITYPASIVHQVITNPDAPFLDHSINLNFDGQQQDAVIILYAGKDYEGGSFFEYINRKLMLVEGEGTNKTPVLVNDMPVLKEFSDASDFYNKVGHNTSYTLHPEEILADHFVALLTERSVPSPSFIEDMKAILMQ